MENCKNLRQCEERLKQVKDKINLIGDINLKSNDIEKLTGFLKEYLRLNNLRNLKKIPFSVSVFLVWKGILEYEGNYWGLISKDLNLNLTNKKRDLLGSIILKTIRIYDLLDFTESKHNRKYVTPILAQGYIPNKYLEDYFNFFLIPFFHKFEINKEEIRYRINNWREDHEGYRDLSKNIKELEKENNIKENKLSRLRYIFDNWDNLTKYSTLKEKEIKKKEIDYLLKFSKEHLQDFQVKINDLKLAVNDIEQLLNKYNIGKELLELKESLNKKRNRIEKNLEKYFILEHIEFNHIGELLQDLEIEKVIDINRTLLNYSLNKMALKQVENDFYIDLLKVKKLYNEYLLIEDEINSNKEIMTSIAEIAATKEELNQEIADCQLEREELKKEIKELKRQRGQYKKNLRILGKGNIEEGKEILQEQYGLQEEMKRIRAELEIGDTKKESLKLHKLIRNMERFSGNKELKDKIDDLNKKITELKEEIEKKEISKRNYSEHFTQLNQATRKLIFYEGDPIVDFIYYSLVLLEKLHNNEEIVEIDIELPLRIKEKMKRWYQENKEDIDNYGKMIGGESEEIYIKKPRITFSKVKREVLVEIPEERISVINPESRWAYFRVYEGKEENLISEIKLEVYRVDENLVKTEKKEIDLKLPAQKYIFELEYDEELVRCWNIDGLNTKAPILSFNEDKKLSSLNNLTTNFWLIAPDNFTIEPSKVVKTREELVKEWNGYSLLYLNWQGIEVINIKDENEIAYTFSKNYDIEPHLVGREIQNMTYEDNIPIYLDEAPNLVFSIDEVNNLRTWEVRLKINEERTKYYKLNELEDEIINNQNQIVQIYLNKLLDKEIEEIVTGVYRVSLRKRDLRANSNDFSFVVMSDLRLNFDKKIYIPCSSSSNNGTLELEADYEIDFTSSEIISKKSEEKSSLCNITFATEQKKIEGNLEYLISEQNFSFPITIEIQAIVWEIPKANDKSESWIRETRELWHEDIFKETSANLRIKIPEYSGKISLSLDDKQEVKTITRNGLIDFDLFQFKSTLENREESVQNIFLKIPKITEESILLFSIRTQWEVLDLNLAQEVEETKKDEEGNRLIILQWEEKGKAQNRVLRLWPLNYLKVDDIEPIEVMVEDKKNELTINEEIRKLPFGQYRLQFDTKNLWGVKQMALPKNGEINTFDVTIGKEEELVKEILQYGLKVELIEDSDNKRYNLQDNYIIDNIRLASGFEEEELYEGEVWHINSNNEKIIMPTNPVRFHLDFKNKSLPFMEDKDTDGVQYCSKCKEIFWELRTKHNEYCKEKFETYVSINRERNENDGFEST